MVSLTNAKWKIVAGAAVAVCIITAILALCSRVVPRHAVVVAAESANGTQETNHSNGDGSLIEDVETPRVIIPPPRQRVPDDAMMAELASVCGTLVQAYSNRQASVIEEWSDKLYGMVAPLALSYEQRKETISQLEDIVRRDFYVVPRDAQPVTFPDVESLSIHLNTLFYGMLLIGDELLIYDWSKSDPAVMEGRMLHILNDFKARYVREGKKDFVDAVDEVFSRWVSFVESERGYTRRRVVECIESVVRSRGVGTREAEMETMEWKGYMTYIAERGASLMLRYGYRPKWIDKVTNVPEPEWRKRERANAQAR